MTTRIAMWSGPRNISTAMMRAWCSRADTVVVDEPFYAAYLDRTDVAHPGRAEVLARHERDPRRVIDALLAPLPAGAAIQYQKQMTHHMLDGIDRAWLADVTSCFLIRDPAEMITSYVKRVPEPTLQDLGLREQVQIFHEVCELTGATPPVIDARDVLLDPRAALAALCDRLGVPFDAAMLAWEPGRRDTDGVWAKHWYDRVEASSGFEPYRAKEEIVPARLADLHAECRDLYDVLAAHRISSDHS